MKKVMEVISTIFYYIVIFLEIIILSFSIYSRIEQTNQSFLGYTLYVVATPSMSGMIETGDIILSKDIDNVDELEVGDVATYIGNQGSYDGKNITHRIEKIYEENGRLKFVFKGIANDYADPVVDESQILNKYVCKLTILTLVYKIISTVPGFLLLVILPIVVIIVSEVLNLMQEIEKEKKKDEKDNAK